MVLRLILAAVKDAGHKICVLAHQSDNEGYGTTTRTHMQVYLKPPSRLFIVASVSVKLQYVEISKGCMMRF